MIETAEKSGKPSGTGRSEGSINRTGTGFSSRYSAKPGAEVCMAERVAPFVGKAYVIRMSVPYTNAGLHDTDISLARHGDRFL